MTSQHGYMDGSLDFKQMYAPVITSSPVFKTNTLLGFLYHEGFPFADLIIKTNLSGRLNDIQGNFTLFVPLDCKCLLEMDLLKLRDVVLFHLLPQKIEPEFITGSTAMFLHTMKSGSRILVENFTSDTILNKNTKIMSVHHLENSIIYFVDSVIEEKNVIL